MKNNQPRLEWADFARSSAIFAVIILHAFAYSFGNFNKISFPEWMIVNTIESFVRWCVPVFFMISGALILKDEEIKITISSIFKRIFRVFIPLVFWSLFYSSYLNYVSGKEIYLFSFLKTPSMYHLWFVYAMIGIYLMIPILQGIYNIIRHDWKLQIYVFLIWILLTSLPHYKNIEFFQLLGLNQVLGLSGFFLLGALILKTPISKLPSIILTLIFIISCTATSLITYKLSKQNGAATEIAYNYLTLNVILSSISIFLIFSRIKLKTRYNNFFKEASELSFIVYFIHVLILDRVIGYLFTNFKSLPITINTIIAIFITTLSCLVISKILRIIPFSKKIFG